MTKAGSIAGTLLGLVCVVSAATGVAAPVTGLAALVGPVLLAAAVMAWRGHLVGQITLSVSGLLLLARFLPIYFQTSRLWPDVPVILLGSFTFGLSVLGILLDRYSSS